MSYTQQNLRTLSLKHKQQPMQQLMNLRTSISQMVVGVRVALLGLTSTHTTTRSWQAIPNQVVRLRQLASHKTTLVPLAYGTLASILHRTLIHQKLVHEQQQTCSNATALQHTQVQDQTNSQTHATKKAQQRCAFLLCATRLRCKRFIPLAIAVWARLIVVAQCCIVGIQ